MNTEERSYCLLSERAELRLLKAGKWVLGKALQWAVPGILLTKYFLVPLAGSGARLMNREGKSRGIAVAISAGVAGYAAAKGTVPDRMAAGIPAAPDGDTDSSAASGIITLLYSDPDGNAGFLKRLHPNEECRQRGSLFHAPQGVAAHDQWGRPFRIRLDTDGDGWIHNPAARDNACCRLRAKALVWSAGKDGDPETWHDNITSW